MSSVTVDWESVRFEFENNKWTLAPLAAKYNTYPMAISRKSKEEGWVKFDPVMAQKSKDVTTPSNPQNILDVVAQRKVKEIIVELGDNYSPIDEPLVLIYGVFYEEFLRLTLAIKEEKDLLTSNKGNIYTNPRYNNWLAVSERLAKIGDRLGMSVASRKRLGLSMGIDKETTLLDFIDEISSSTGETFEI